VRYLHFSRVLLLLLPLLLTPTVRAQEASPLRSAAAVPTITARIDAALAAPGLKNGIAGVLVKSLKDGRTLYEKNSDTALMPASNMKLLTATTALARLGPEFRYPTTVYGTGRIEADGTLTGDLYLKGTGDPSLDSERLKRLAEELKAKGVRRFHGRLVADASRFDEQTLAEGWPWDNEQFYYQAQVSALNCDANVILVEALPAPGVGDPVQVRIGGANGKALGLADTRYVTIIVRATTDPAVSAAPAGTAASASGNTVRFQRRRASNEIVVSGALALTDAPVTRVITVEDPALFTVTRFGELLRVVGIETPKDGLRVAKGTIPVGTPPLLEQRSEPLSVLVSRFLKTSDNLYGECLLKTLGAEKGTRGSWDGGARVVQDFLQEAGVETGGLYIADGSGLSRRNTVTPRLLAGLLAYAESRFPEATKAAFMSALPVGGVDGTLRSRFKGTAAENNVRAKTGTVFSVSGLSGYVTTKSGERLVFSILLNHFAGAGGESGLAKRTEDAIVLALTEAVP
jgi:serine-type D-Ala-D-Ala carboxypeptidase/endopeptidase (penicillin-binding protein 4)